MTKSNVICVFISVLLCTSYINCVDEYVILSTLDHGGTSHIEAISGDPRAWVPNHVTGEDKDTIDLTAPYDTHLFQRISSSFYYKQVVWSNNHENDIEKTTFFTSNNSLTVSAGQINAYTSAEIGGVAVDWLSHNVYWTDQVYNWLLMSPLDRSTDFAVIADTDLDKPGDICINAKKSILFWTDYGKHPKIERSDLDGQNRKTLVNTGLIRPVALDTDLTTNKLYWLDTGNNQIGSCDMNGYSRQQFLQAGFLSFGSGLNVYKSMIFVVGTTHDKAHLHVINMTDKSVKDIGLKAKAVYDVDIFSQNKQQKGRNPCKYATCSAMCVGKRNNGQSQCVCPWGQALHSTRCVDTGYMSHPKYLFSTPTELCTYDVWTPDLTTKQLNESCVVNFKIDTLHYLSALRKNNSVYVGIGTDISKVALSHQGKLQMVVKKAGSIKGLSVDWLSENIYWVDDQGVISVSTADGQHRVTLITSLSAGVRGLLVDPVGGKMYWTSLSDKPHIGQASLNGEDISEFVTGDMRQPEQMTIDYKENRLYWTDSVKDVIESIALNGTDRKVMVTLENAVPFSIAVYQDHIAWTDRSTASRGIHWAYKDDRQGGTRTVQHTKTPGTILLYGDYSQPHTATNGCSENNGGCAHLCLPRGMATKQCRCGTGYVLKPNKLDCVAASASNMDNPLLVINDHSMFLLDVTSDKVSRLPIPELVSPVAIDVDTQQQQIFWTDATQKRIYKASFNGSNREVLTDGVLSDGLVVDAVTKVIYYTDSDTDANSINFMDYNGNNAGIVLNQGLDEPRAITINNRVLYWTDWGKNPNIMSASVDGSNVKTIVDRNLGWPNGIAIDRQADTLYWCDGKLGTVEKVKTDGTGRLLLNRQQGSQFFGIALIGEFLYVTDWKAMHLKKLNKTGGMIVDIGNTVFTQPHGIAPLNKDRHGTAIYKEPTTTTTTTHTVKTSRTTKVVPQTTHYKTTVRTTISSTHHHHTTKHSDHDYTTTQNTSTLPVTAQGVITGHGGHLNLTIVLAIAITVGGLVLLVVVVTVGSICCIKHKRERSRPTVINETMYLTTPAQRYVAGPQSGDTPPPYNLNPSPLKYYGDTCNGQQDNMINSGIQENIYSSINDPINNATESDYLCPVKT